MSKVESQSKKASGAPVKTGAICRSCRRFVPFEVPPEVLTLKQDLLTTELVERASASCPRCRPKAKVSA